MENLREVVTFCANYHIFDALTLVIGLVATISLSWRSKKLKSYQMRTYAPTIWTSLGILFTFLSIYLGLLIFEGDDIKQLIKSIIPAFSTSIIGIVGAIISSVRNKKVLADKEYESTQYFNKLRGELGIESDIDSDSPELLLFKIISAVNQRGNSIENILKTNQSSTNGKSDEIYHKFDELLKKLNDSTKGALNEAFNTQNDNFQNKYLGISDLLKGLNTSTNTALTTALDAQRKDFENSMRDLKSSFNETLLQQNNILENKLNSLQDKNTGLIRDLINITREKLAEESDKRNNELKSFITEENEKFSGFIGTTKQDVDEIVSGVRRLFEEDIKQTIEQFAEKQHEISAETIKLCNTKLVEDSNEYLKNHTGMMSVYLAKLENQMNYTCDSFLDAVNTMLQTIKEKLDELHEKENKLLKTIIDGNTTNIETLLGENQNAIKAIADGIKEDYEKIKAELEKSQERWKGQAEKIEQDNLNKIENIHGATEAKVKAINDSITTLGEDLQNAFNGIKAKIETSIIENTNSINSLLDANKKSIEKVSSEIKSDNEDMKAYLSETNQKWKDEVKEINQDAAKEIQEIQTKITSIESALHSSLNTIIEEVTKSITEFEKKQNEVKEFILKNNKGLQTDLTKQIHDAFQIKELSTERDKLITGIQDTINDLSTQTKSILANLSKINDELKNNNDSLKESSAIYRNTVVNSKDLIAYIDGTLNLLKSHVTQMNVIHSEINTLHTEVDTFQKALQELENSIKEVERMKDGLAKKQTEKEKPNKQ